MKLSVIGIGYVGLVAAACLSEVGNHVVCVDNDPEKIDLLNKGHIPIYEPGLTEIVARNVEAKRLTFTTDIGEGVKNSLITFIGVGTPSASDGSADMSAVYAVSEEIAKAMSDYHIIVTKSTVPIDTHKKVSQIVKANTSHPFDYVSNPEFLKEGSAVDDFMKPDRVIIGTDNPAVREIMKQLYAPFMRKSSRMIFMDSASAEMTKYAANAMLATRITFMNELTALCDKFGADIEYVRHGIGSDSRIGNSFLFAGLGYGGSCFPKDVRALAFMGDEQGVDLTIAKAVQAANYCQQDRFAQRVIDYYKGTPNTVLGVWGLAFKAKTDDVRESPAIRCIQKFIDAGFKVRAFDPEAMENAAAALGDCVEMCDNEYDVIPGADGLVVMTDWQEFRSPDFERIASGLKKPVIFDGRNLYEPSFAARNGIEYYGIGRTNVTA
jgi:UDPglucose 6-dehydrogenase